MLIRSLSVLIRTATFIAALVAIAAVVGTCVQQGATDLIYTDAKGMPFDWAGKHLRCRDSQCPGLLTWVSNYDYECDKCGLKVTCRRGSDGLDWGE